MLCAGDPLCTAARSWCSALRENQPKCLHSQQDFHRK